MKLYALLLISSLMLSGVALSAQAQSTNPTHIIINSQDWRDTYSAMLSASLTSRTASFLVSDRHSGLILGQIPTSAHIWTINSQSSPFVTGFGNFVENNGYSVEDFTYDNMNLEFARQYDTTSFIIIDDSVGYNAISVAPYAVVSKSFVLFADRTTIDEVTDLLAEKSATDVLIYGHVDREVLNALAQYNPVIINEDGDRFANNIEIVKLYQDRVHSKQAILTNGEFIERAIMSGREPVIFIGTNNVPDVTREYIQGSDIQVGVLIGNELVNTATFIRRQVGISVFVKFAQSARSPSNSISQVEALDMFYLPRYNLNLVIEGITYNAASTQLEITLGNRVDQGIYAKGSYSVTNTDGTIQTVGDTEAIFVEGNEVRTLVYDINAIDTQGASVDAFVIYGEARNALERTIEETYCLSCDLQLGLVDIIDNCDINVSSLTFDTRRQLFRMGIQNPSDVGCYIDVQLLDVVVAAERVDFALENTAFIDSGMDRSVRIKVELEEEDFEDNPFINTKVFYGQRENRLINIKEQRFPLVFETAAFGGLTAATGSLLVVILLIVAILVWRFYSGRKRRKRQR